MADPLPGRRAKARVFLEPWGCGPWRARLAERVARRPPPPATLHQGDGSRDAREIHGAAESSGAADRPPHVRAVTGSPAPAPRPSASPGTAGKNTRPRTLRPVGRGVLAAELLRSGAGPRAGLAPEEQRPPPPRSQPPTSGAPAAGSFLVQRER